MKRAYPTILTKVDGAVLVEVPDMTVLTEGTDVSNAIEMARDAICLAGISMQDHGDEIPEPSECSSINVSKGTFAEEGNGMLTLVDVDFDTYRKKIDQKMVRRNVTLPNWLNAAAEEANLNVSGVLQEALKARLGV
ncbi:MAG: type II toxin-antitoxin system HicB family antitoxin [Lentihominibacter sp.]|jgi:predicted RNase H-like HicB family nuclease